MAPTGEGSGAPSASLTKSDLLEVKEDLKKHLSSLIDSKLNLMMEQIAALSSTVQDVAKTADAAHDECVRNGGHIKALQATERQLKDRIAWLEQRARSLNLKLRGFPESTDFNKNLLHNVITWIMPMVHLEGAVSPTITTAYRVGPPSAIRPNYPRDIIITFLYANEREATLQMARSTSSLTYSGSKILVLLDLPQAVLIKRRGMKPITDQLRSKGIRFRWSSSSDVVVVKDGAQDKAEDLASGRTLLAALEISLPSE